MTNKSKLINILLHNEDIIRYKVLKEAINNNIELINEYKIFLQIRRQNILNNTSDYENINPIIIEFFELHLIINDLVQEISFFIQKGISE